ncbi:hypothetical protein [Streptomyces sp. H27-D2]|uniref:hypothetical protein n=1 Tax=Streptomyces sp. H27-D2 TaxID=3046304 RepID=UPI002DB77E68|nr:hypothetical protein [Streptomyces sp. H27-D2]MEC4019443.1 hypothetical protein [Streptomyces sp. H27-D2]
MPTDGTVPPGRVPAPSSAVTGRAAAARGPMPVHYHQFHVSDLEGSLGPELPSHTNGLVGVEDGVAHVLTGIHTGTVDLEVTLHRHEPAPGEGPWEDIVEIPAHSVSGELAVHALMVDLEEEFPTLASAGPGDYRIRVHARGRDTAIDLAPDEITEWYLLQVWPAAPQPPRALLTTSGHGAVQRASAADAPAPRATVSGAGSQDDPAGIRARAIRPRRAEGDA